MTSALDLREIEQSIEQMECIVNARIVGSDTEIHEIHVLSNRGKPPRLLARDIETLLNARYHLDVDHKKISIVSFDLKEETKGKDTDGGLFRPVLWSLGWRRSCNGITAEVEIKLGEKTCRAEVTEDHPKFSNRYPLIAGAVLQCVNELMGSRTFTMRDVSVHHFSGFDVVLAVVDYHLPGGETGLLTGTAVVKDDFFEATARSTLDALNRKIIVYLESS